MGSNTDVIVVGAGLSGLAAGIHLARSGISVKVVEASDEVGGRVKTDVVDGYRLDRGFQVFNTAYPEARRMLDYDQLDLRPFLAGASIYADGRRHLVANPLRHPAGLASTLAAPIGSLSQKVKLVAMTGRDLVVPVRRMQRRPDTTTAVALDRWGLSGPMTDRFLRPFLSGVLLDADLATSARFFHLVWRSFARGSICVPAGGMAVIPAQLASLLGPERLLLGRPVESVGPDGVTLSEGSRIAARAVIVATDPSTAGSLLPGLVVPPMHDVTTYYHLADGSPLRSPVLVLDGEARLIVNTVVLSEAAPEYAAGGRSLVSTSVLGLHADGDTEAAILARLADLYGVSTASWELLGTYPVKGALPVMAPGQALRQTVRWAPGVYVCGDHRDTPSIQGALVSGRRAARAVLDDLGHSSSM